MIVLGIQKYLASHTATVAWGVSSVAVAMPAATWASPFAYIEYALAGASTTGTLTGVKHRKLRLADIGGDTTATITVTLAGAGAYIGATANVLSTGTDSVAIDQLWCGACKREPGLLGTIAYEGLATRSGYRDQPQRLQSDMLSVWASEAAWSELDGWYEWALLALAQTGPIEIRGETITDRWWISETDLQVESLDGEGVLTWCDLPVRRAVQWQY